MLGLSRGIYTDSNGTPISSRTVVGYIFLYIASVRIYHEQLRGDHEVASPVSSRTWFLSLHLDVLLKIFMKLK